MVVVQVDETDYLAGLKDCKTHLHGRIILSKGDKTLTHLDLIKKLQSVWKALGLWKIIPDGDQAQVDMEANQQDQEEVEAQMEDAHGGQSPSQRLTRSMFKGLGARGQLFSLFVISLVEGA